MQGLQPPGWPGAFAASWPARCVRPGQRVRILCLGHRGGIARGRPFGTTGPDSFLPWGTNGTEPALLHQAGLSSLAAIEAVTANGPRTLGPQAPRSGQLRPGFDADLLALRRNPLEDLTVLADPKEITHVWKRGQLVKHPVAP